MIIDNPDVLRTWLTSYLEPLCDADPSALAKYVVALIKKDKTIDEVRASMSAQMEVFLQEQTVGFVDVLFKALDSKSYLNPASAPIPTTAKSGAAAMTSAATDLDSARNRKSSGVAEEPEEHIIKTPDSTTATKPQGSLASRLGHVDEFKTSRELTTRHGRQEGRSDDRDRHPHRSSRRYRSRSRSRSRSPGHFHRRSRSRSPFSSRRRRPRSRSPSPPRRFRRSSGGNRGDEPFLAKKPRCRDYDEKGFCLQGDLCKFDHGSDAVVLEDAVVQPYQPVGTSYSDTYVPTGSVSLPLMSVPPPGFATVMATTAMPYIDPSRPSVYSRLGSVRGFRGGPRGRGRGRGGLAGRLGKRAAASQLVVKNIPPAFNTIAHLNNHFARFGTLVNVQVHFEGDPEAALVSFADAAEAEMAFNSTEAVLGNRFIKMFFHRAGSVRDRIEVKIGDADDAMESDQKTQIKATALAAIEENQKMLEAKAQMKKDVEEKKKEQTKKMSDIQKSKHDLLDKLIEEQKTIITKLEEGKGSMRPEERAGLMTLFKSISDSIKTAKEDLQLSIHVTVAKKGPAQLQRELLDAELELFQAQQNDNSPDVGHLQKRVNVLLVEAARAGVLPTSRGARRGFKRGAVGGVGGRGAARGFQRGRGRGVARPFVAGSTSVDRRPARILVTGFDWEEKEALGEHFQKFGEVVEFIQDESAGSIVVHFKTRRDAEAAMKGGSEFNERHLELSWYTGATPSEYQTDRTEEDADDDYTPLDPTYLPPGLEEEEEASRGSLLQSQTSLSNMEADERSWKR